MQEPVNRHNAHWRRAPIRTLVLAALATITLTGGAWMLQYASSRAYLERAGADRASRTPFEISSETQSWFYLSTGVLLAGLGLLIFVVVLERRRRRLCGR